MSADDAAAAVDEIAKELADILGRAKSERADVVVQKHNRWMDRASEALNRRVSPLEAQKFADLYSRTSAMSDLQAFESSVFTQHAFLEALSTEIRQHPKRYAKKRAATKPERKKPRVVPLAVPERVTPAWVWKNADGRWVVGAIGAIVAGAIALFLFGFSLGRNTPAAVRKLLGDPPPPAVEQTGRQQKP